MRKKQKQKAPQSALETLLLVLLAALTLVPLFLVVQNSFKSRFYISGDPFALPNKETFVALENYISGLSAGGFFAAFGRSLLITVVSVGLIVLCTSMAAWYLMRVRTALTKGMYYLFVFSMIVPFQMVMYTMTYLVGRAKLNTVLVCRLFIWALAPGCLCLCCAALSEEFPGSWRRRPPWTVAIRYRLSVWWCCHS
jgi:raffinose/stachyose/melibiose transport system permease protein